MTTSALLRLVLAKLLLSKGADCTTKIKHEESGGEVHIMNSLFLNDLSFSSYKHVWKHQ